MTFYSQAQVASGGFDAAGLAERVESLPGSIVQKQVTFTGANDTGGLSASAALTTALAGANNDLDITAATAGAAGNSITVAYVDPGVAGASIGVVVNGNAIVVNLATSTAVAATGVLTSDATNITAADTVTIGSQVYTFKTALTEVIASAVLTSDNTNVSNGDTVTVGDITYTFVTALTVGNSQWEVVIGASADLSLTNLAAAINASAGAGVAYGTGTYANPKATSGAVSSHTLTLTATVTGVAGNAYVSTETSSHLSFGAATFANGVDPIANEIFRGVDADTSLGNLVAAINGAAGAATKYSSNTAVNTNVTAGAVTAHATTLTAKVAGTAANSVATTETSSHLSFGNTTLTGGVAGGTITTTAANVTTAISGSTPANALVSTANHAGNDGTGKVTAMAATPLTGGSDGYVPLFTVSGDVEACVLAVCQSSVTGATTTIALGVTGATGLFTAAQVGTTLTAHKMLDKTGLVAQTATPATTPNIVLSSQNIIATLASGSGLTGGVVNFYCIFIPISPGATVTAS